MPRLRYFLLLLAATQALAQPAGPFLSILPGSIRPVTEAPQGAPLDPRKPLITRTLLTATEEAAPLSFEINLRMRNFRELQDRVARGERIPLKEMAAKYEPLAADYDTVAGWITGQGLTITRRDSHHMALFVRGSVSQLRRAFRVAFARVSVEGREYSSAITAPSVPAALSPLLLGVNGLQPHLHAHKHIVRRQDQPDALNGSASYLPKQIAQAYDVTALYGTGIEGSGETIAIVIDTFPTSSDLIAFWADAGVSQTIGNIQFIQAVPGTLPSPSGEETLDTEWSSSIAPAVHVRVYAATDLANADLDETYAQVYEDVTNHPGLNIHQMSMSYGEGETYTTQSQVNTDDQYFAELAAAGVTIFAASGDDGSTPGNGGTGDESGPLNVESPASDPNVAGVGGTTLVLDSSNIATSETVWNSDGGASGGGLSEYFGRPAWQTGTGVVSGNDREVPDIAAAGDPNYGAVIVQGGTKQTVGGTSWATPTWAGICALLNEARSNAGQTTLGILGPHIYPLLSGSDYSATYLANFRDITSGNNATRRSSGDYKATAGFDLCTGLGAPLVTQLAGQLTNFSALVGLQMPAAIEEIAPGTSGTFTVTVTGTTATYQWQRMPIGTATWSNLTEGGAYSGVNGPSLTVADTTPAMSGDRFQCLVGIGSSTVTTSPASVLIVDTPLGISTLAGRAGATGIANGTGRAAEFNYPSGVAVDNSGNLYVADYGNNQIREISATGVVSTPYGNVDGNTGSANGAGNNGEFNAPNSVAIDGSGNLYVADSGNNLIREISGGVVGTLAGTNGQFDSPEGVAVDSSENVYVADTGNDVIWKISRNGTVTLLAGQDGVAGYADGAATSKALFNGPVSVAVDSKNNVYVADLNNDVVRKISSGVVSTVAGQAGQTGYTDGIGTNTLFNAPFGLAVDGSNNVYIADAQAPSTNSTAAGNDLLRKLTPTGVVSTLAGDTGVTGTADGTGSAAEFYSLQAAAVGASGVVYLADTYNQTIRTGTSSSTGSLAPPLTMIISLSGDLAFGDVGVGLSATNTLTISNTGNTTLTVSNISYPPAFSGNWSSGTIAAGASQTVAVIFSPSNAVDYGGSIVVTSNATAGSGDIAVSGAGVVTPTEPVVITASATDIGATGATLAGEVNPEGASTTVYFQYGLTGTYGSSTAGVSAGVGTVNIPFNAAISGLRPLTEYHYRAVASNGGGMVSGSDATFTTAAFSTTAAASTGEAAAGVSGAEFYVVGNPAINALDYLAFSATLAPGVGGVTASDDAGIWADAASGEPYLVARKGAVAPGTGNAIFSALGDPVYNDNEAVAFFATLKASNGSAISADTGIWSTSGGSLLLVARRGGAAPGYPAGTSFTAFNALALPDTGGILLRATVSRAAQNHGVWAGNSTGDLHLLVKEGDTINGRTITSLNFLPTLSFVSGQTRSFAQATGALVCGAGFSDHTTGILDVSGTALQLAALSGSSAPGVTGGRFSAFGTPALNANGDIAFRATLAAGPGITNSDKSGIWADETTGTLQLIAQTGGTAAGTTDEFSALSDPVFNDNEAVAFRGKLKTGNGGAATANATGIWAYSGGSLALVAQQGGEAAGCPNATFSAFTSLALPDQGGVVFLATLNTSGIAGVSSANNTGIWAVDTGGNLKLIARKGSPIGGKTIASLSFLPALPRVSGQSRNINQSTGDLAFEAGFTDGTSAIFVIAFP